MDGKGNKGQFKPGDSRAGRPKGCANKATLAVRDAIARVLECNSENFAAIFVLLWLVVVAVEAKAAEPSSGLRLMT
jgi:hypothetical protein